MNMKKKGDVTVGTLVAIVLAIVVIAFLIYGFSTGWTNLWGKISGFGGESNVDDIVLACQLACQQRAKDAFCNVDRKVNYGSERLVWTGVEFENKTRVSVPCVNLTNSSAYGVGVASCPEIVCN